MPTPSFEQNSDSPGIEVGIEAQSKTSLLRRIAHQLRAALSNALSPRAEEKTDLRGPDRRTAIKLAALSALSLASGVSCTNRESAEQKEGNNGSRITEIAIKSQELIFSTEPEERKAYYLDPETLKIVASRKFDDSLEKKDLDAWHDQSRRRLVKTNRFPADKVDYEKDIPFVNVSPPAQESLRRKHRDSQKLVKSENPYFDGKTRLEAVKIKFYQELKRTKLYRFLGSGKGEAGKAARHFVAICVFGQVTQESGWNPNAHSHAGATGPWQILPSTANDLNREFPNKVREDTDLNDFLEATTAAVYYYESVFKYIEDELEEVKRLVGAEDDVQFAKDFVVPCLINSYISGKGTMKKMLKWFIANKEMVKKDLDENQIKKGKDLFFQLSRKYHESGKQKSYGLASRLYYIKCMANARLLFRREKDGLLEREVTHNLANPLEKLDQDFAFAHSYKVAEHFDHEIQSTAEQSPRDLQPEVMGWIRKQKGANGKNVLVQARSENRKDLNRLKEKNPNLFANLDANPHQGRLSHRALKGSTGISRREQHLLLSPTVEELLPEFAKRVNQYLWKKGMPKRYWVRPLLTSAYRTRDYQKHLSGNNANATRDTNGSAHEYGNTFDVSRQRADLIDLHSMNQDDELKFYEIGPSPQSNEDDSKERKGQKEIARKFNKKTGFIKHLDRALAHASKALSDEGKLFGIRENNQACYHLAHRLDTSELSVSE